MTDSNRVSSGIRNWVLIGDDDIDIAFLARQHRRRLSRTVQLALTAYHCCNPDHEPLVSVFASRYGEYVRTFGILEDIVGGLPTSPAAFSVSVHNTPSGIAAIGTGNPAPSSTVAANAATIEAAFIEATLLAREAPERDLIFVFVDEPLPEPYAEFRRPGERAQALGLRLATDAGLTLGLRWSGDGGDPERGPDGIPEAAFGVSALLDAGQGRWSSHDGRLAWEWRVD
jgi:hypothetical protein